MKRIALAGFALTLGGAGCAPIASQSYYEPRHEPVYAARPSYGVVVVRETYRPSYWPGYWSRGLGYPDPRYGYRDDHPRHDGPRHHGGHGRDDDHGGGKGGGKNDGPRGGRPDRDAGRGDAGRGDAGRGDAGRGDAGRGDAGRGDAGRGDAGRGDAGQGGGRPARDVSPRERGERDDRAARGEAQTGPRRGGLAGPLNR